MSSFIGIGIDDKSVIAVKRSLNKYGDRSTKAVRDVVNRTALAIESDAKEKITSDGHIVTNRLRASIHAEIDKSGFSYSDDDGNSFDGALRVNTKDLEAIAGTNVDYAMNIEYNYDSFMNYAAQRQKKPFISRLNKALKKLKNEFESR